MTVDSLQRFDTDYDIWNQEVEAIEQAMEQFVKQLLQPIENTEAKLLVLARFDRLGLDCLCLDRRYLDVFVMYEKELVQLKDVYG